VPCRECLLVCGLWSRCALLLCFDDLWDEPEFKVLLLSLSRGEISRRVMEEREDVPSKVEEGFLDLRGRGAEEDSPMALNCTSLGSIAISSFSFTVRYLLYNGLKTSLSHFTGYIEKLVRHKR